jgi:small subunit ribosomal protein S16
VSGLLVKHTGPLHHPRINHGRHSTLRGGSKGRPFFNIVVSDKRVRRDGRFIERLGFYNPTAKGGEESIRIAQDRLTYWKSVGAQASPTVDRLIKQAAAAAPKAAA